MTHTIREKRIDYYMTEKHHHEDEDPEKQHLYAQIVEEYADEYAGSDATDEERNQIIYEVIMYDYQTGDNIQHMSQGTLESWGDVKAHLESVMRELYRTYHVDQQWGVWERGCYCEMCVARLGEKK